MMKNLIRNNGVPAGLPAEFHISLAARRKYGVNRRLFGTDGKVVFSDEAALRELVAAVNRARAPGEAIRAGEINAAGLIDEIWHFMLRRYRREKSPGLPGRLEKHLQSGFGASGLGRIREVFVREFPPGAVFFDGVEPGRYLEGRTGKESNRRLVLEELLLLGLANRNPAFSPFEEFFDEGVLEAVPGYRDLIESYRDFFLKEPGFGRKNSDFFAFLVEPIKASPHSLGGQLEYIYKNWSELLSEEIRLRLLVGTDIIREEEKSRSDASGDLALRRGAGEREGAGGGPFHPRGFPEDYEAFSPDLDWMPRVVLMVKNAGVWFEQLSRRYGRTISRLDQIPDEELDALRDWGFTSLWLIGIWTKCRASQLIKRLCGNREAGPSAYSLYDYEIAGELGGEKALQSLKERANRRGIRLASDMVPNHAGIFSRWVVEHPEWFIQLPEPPFPGYRFTGPNLSNDPRVAVFIEDGYWNRTDAAVVFKRLDRLTGEVRYIYHGNDGTNMPWNDTAQLDYLKKEVRDAVIGTILRVARNFPVIRFDAAMVLTKKHFQRLWYPPPGAGGDIPSRAGRGVSPARFERLFPLEFWREVVDRVAEKEPETLLLAEAFWLLEGYFVRTLGMHRVYNSAFMNMLKLESNAEYRGMLKDFLEFEPQILKRFVNFMSNPDEATAAEGFGDGDKYFGVCSMMATLPGLPLFGHGQVEGFREKYGMEFLRARLRENINSGLVERHRREIFPLLRKRYLFSDVENFILYDFYGEDGKVNENVYVYSNRYREERSLVVYHNFYAEASGWIRVSAAWSEKKGGAKRLRQVDLVEGLKLRDQERDFALFREQRSGLEYIRPVRDLRERGLFMSLRPYGVKVFSDFRVIRDGAEGVLSRLAENLRDRGVPNLDEEIRKLYFGPLHAAFRDLFSASRVAALLGMSRGCPSEEELRRGLAEEFAEPLAVLLDRAGGYTGRLSVPGTVERLTDLLLHALYLFPSHPGLPFWTSSRYSRPALRALAELSAGGRKPEVALAVILLWAVLSELAGGKPAEGAVEVSRLKKWYLEDLVVEFFTELGLEWAEARDRLDLVAILLRGVEEFKRVRTRNHLHLLIGFFRDDTVRRYLRFNWHQDILWLNKESLEKLAFWLFAVAQIERSLPREVGKPVRLRGLVLYRGLLRIEEMASESSYRVEGFLRALESCRSRPRRKKDAAAAAAEIPLSSGENVRQAKNRRRRKGAPGPPRTRSAGVEATKAPPGAGPPRP